MEALVAVGLAGNVVQFAQGAGALIAFAKEIRDSGSPKSIPRLIELSKTLNGHASVLQSRLRASIPLTEENQNLLDLAAECEQAGEAFITYLGTFKNGSPSGLASVVRDAIRYQWSSKKINDYTERLERLRGSLILATVLACRTSSEGNHEEILAHLKEIQNDHQNRQTYDQIGVIQAAIELLTNAVQNQTNDKLEAIQNGIQLCVSGVITLRRELEINTTTRVRERQILNWVDFRQNHWRYESVDPAYRQTYEWLLKSPTAVEHWDDFSAHLQGDAREPYFINGKAGSGKSTLMKFVYDHARTGELLKRWAGSKELVKLQFFFWNLGTTLQRTHTGMLRGMLHAVLEKHPELIPAVFPKLYRNWEDWDSTTEPVLIEVKQAFARMMEKSSYLRLAIFIDGIDEFEGAHRDMTLFIRSLACQHVKLVVSSRPLNNCLSSLVGCPTLRVQDLTRRDMEVFVDGELNTHYLMTRLIRQFPTRAPQFASEIVSKSEGVFLWVKLVVRVLIEGLENGDSLDELQTKLAALPSDLRDLYRRMFGKMSMEYQKESAVMFQLHEKWLKISRDQSLPGIVMWYAINNPAPGLDRCMGHMVRDQYEWGMSSLVKRVQSRCCGLLEARCDGRTLDGLSSIVVNGIDVSIEDIGALSISYLHRTVHEFITIEEVWTGIRHLTNDMSFGISARLASACLSTMRLARQTSRLHIDYVRAVTQLCQELADSSPGIANASFFGLDRTMSQLDRSSWSDPFDLSMGSIEPIEHWSSTLVSQENVLHLAPGLMKHTNIYTYAAGRGLFARGMPFPTDVDEQFRFETVFHALLSWIDVQEIAFCTPSLKHKARTLDYLLAEVMGPEGMLSDIALWHVALVICRMLESRNCYFEAATLLKITLCASRSPETLWNSPLRPPGSIWQVDCVALLMKLETSLRRSLIREHTQLANDLRWLIKTTNNQAA